MFWTKVRRYGWSTEEPSPEIRFVRQHRSSVQIFTSAKTADGVAHLSIQTLPVVMI
jgi:hypothetical protein